MAIATAIQRGSRVFVYDERKHELFSKNGELHGYTGSSVSIKERNHIYVYDEKGHITADLPAK